MMSNYQAEYRRRSTGLPLLFMDGRPRASAGGTGADVVAHLATQEARVPAILDAVAQLQRDAEAVAGEHGHTLGAWYQSEHLLTAAICEGCGASVCLREEGYGSNADPLKWLREHPCERARFYVAKSRRGTGWTYVVRDRERAAYGPRAMGPKGKCAKVAAALNAELLPAPAVDIDELVKARAKVERARKALARAEAALGLLEARAVDGASSVPNVAQAPAAPLVVAHFTSGPVRPMARPGSGFVKGKRGKR